MDQLLQLWQSTGLYQMHLDQFAMICIGLTLLYLAIVKGFEPLLLVPIGFGGLLANIPGVDIAVGDGILHQFYALGIETGMFPLLIFMGVGAMTDFGPLLANPKTLFLGAAAQFGIFATLLGALGLSELGSLTSRFRKRQPLALLAARMARPPSMSPGSWRRTCWAPSRLPPILIWRWCRSSSRRSCAC